MMRLNVIGFAAACALASAGPVVAGAGDPSLRVHNPRLEVKWDSPDVRPGTFDRVMLAPIELEFRPVRPLAGPYGAESTRTDFPVPERSRQLLAATFDEVLRDELAGNRHFTLTDEPGPGVLLLKPALRDIVSRVPPEEPPASRIYVDTVGDGTLVVDFVDAATGRTLGSATDRRTAESTNPVGQFGAIRANVVATGFQVRMLARHWGMSLKSRIEQLYFAAKPR